MTKPNDPAPMEFITGKKFLYEKPELLTKEDHGSLGFSRPDRPFDHVKSARAIPLTMIEFGSGQRHCPIVFSRLEDPIPLAIVGLTDDVNLFVDDNGEWDQMCYQPSYLRCYPFTFAAEQEGKMAVIIDRAAASISENPEFPFFIDGKISEHTDALMQFCAKHEKERTRTREFCAKLVELNLLAPQQATHTPEGASEAQPLAEYVSVDVQKLNELDSDTVFDLHKNGWLSAIYLQIYSLENWRHLMARKIKRARH